MLHHPAGSTWHAATNLFVCCIALTAEPSLFHAVWLVTSIRAIARLFTTSSLWTPRSHDLFLLLSVVDMECQVTMLHAVVKWRLDMPLAPVVPHGYSFLQRLHKCNSFHPPYVTCTVSTAPLSLCILQADHTFQCSLPPLGWCLACLHSPPMVGFPSVPPHAMCMAIFIDVHHSNCPPVC